MAGFQVITEGRDSGLLKNFRCALPTMRVTMDQIVMNSQMASILTDPQPRAHIVYPYSDVDQIAEAVGTFTAAGLAKGESVVLITTPDKREAIERHLAASGVDVWDYRAADRLIFFDAAGMLCNVLNRDEPTSDRFHSVITGVVELARQKAPSGRVRAYGEMVNLLCGQNDLEAAALLEGWWNDLIRAQSIALLCSYSLDLLQPHESTGLPKRLLDAHTHVLTA